MSFKVSARTILQLGAELISSDGVAFYELVKNAFDAGSPNVEIEVIVRVKNDVVHETLAELEAAMDSGTAADVAIAIGAAQRSLLNGLDLAAPGAAEFRAQVKRAASGPEVVRLAREANYIEIRDSGGGMSLSDLTNIYLTIGTANRAIQRASVVQTGGTKRILGEKGIGRLSTMRLGDLLRVRTTQPGDDSWSELVVDWAAFARADSSRLIGDIDVTPGIGPRKESPHIHGTHIRISDLAAAWDQDRLRSIVDEQFSKFTDPLTPSLRFPVVATFNGVRISVPRFEALLFEHAHAKVTARFGPGEDGHFELTTNIEYSPPGARQPHKRNFQVRGLHLFSVTDGARESLLRSLGPWELTAYWYNRRILTRIEGIGDLRAVRALVKRWAGVMVYRDGFRVQPYGNEEDDWLGLDRAAFGSKGFKLNRNQIIAKVDISAVTNPNLVDQTNREGLRDNREKRLFARLLLFVFLKQLKTFLEEVDEELKTANAPTLVEVVDRLLTQDQKLKAAVAQLTVAVPGISRYPAMQILRDTVDQIRSLLDDTQRLAESYERGQGQLVNMASIGLTVEILAHELTRATGAALKVLKDARPSDSVGEVFGPLQAQLETLSRRLKVLDPLSTAGRQHKTNFDLVAWVKTILGYHDPQFARHDIRIAFRVVPRGGREPLQVHMVKGMVVQVLENLVSNSVYWLKVRKSYGDTFEPEIRVTLDTEAREIRVWDNGPGIDPARAETIFLPFNSTKPPSKGKGLGLYVSREIAQYSGGSLYLEREPDPNDGMLHTFVFQLPEPKNQ